MERRINRKKYNIYAFDIESHNDIESIEKKETSMWLGCLIDENSKITDEDIYFYNMDSFLNRLEELTTSHRTRKGKRNVKNICIYIYNLSFEWSFILPVLLERGFSFSEKIEKDSEYCFNSISTKTCSSVWEIKMKFGKNNGFILFRDLAKIFGGGLSNVAKSFNLETQKGEIDYRLNRLHNHIVTEEEKEYIFKDVRIIIDILLKVYEDHTFWRVCSMASYSMTKLIKAGYPRKVRPYLEFRKDYPFLKEEETNFLRKGVEGGLCYVNPLFQFKDIHQKIVHVDAHQMHPSQMYNKLFPIGEGKYFKGEPKEFLKHINCCRIRISYSGVKLHSVIKLVGLPIIDGAEIVVWDFEIPTLKKCYENLEIEYIDFYQYEARRLKFRNYVKNNYLKRLDARKKGDTFNVLYYKLLNNSAYGKFLERSHVEIYENYINEFGIIDSKIKKKDFNEIAQKKAKEAISKGKDVNIEEIIENEKNNAINAKYTYLPIGSCIPAYSRVELIEKALLIGYKNVIYVDTDSIFFIYSEETFKRWNELFDHNDFLGGWALEEIVDRGQFTASKRYKTELEGKATIKSGGINFNHYINERIKETGDENYQLSYEEVNIVSSSWKVQRAYRVKGGTIIEFQDKEIKVVDKYKNSYDLNFLKYPVI